MPRIPDDQLQRLKEEVSVERLVESAGIELKRSGKDRIGRCPFHEDDTASLVVTPSKNLWHCFGCGIGGGPIDWVIKKNGVSFRHAVELLREGLPALAAQDGGIIRHSTVRTLSAPIAFDADDQALLNQTVAYYHERLRETTEAKAYLASRGLDDAALIERFKLGVADRTLGLRLPHKNRKAGAQIRGQLTKIGLYRESGHEHFNGSLIVPVFDENGQVQEVYGRKILDNLRAGTPKHLYLPTHEGRSRGVFNIEALMQEREIILCEALIDALTFWSAGYRNVTSAFGIEGFTEEHVMAFKRYGTQRVLIAYDRDEAGERGAARVAERLMMEGIECFRVQFPKGMDANGYACKVTPATKGLGLVLRKAVWLGSGAAPALTTASDETLAAKALAAKKVKETEGVEPSMLDLATEVIEEPPPARTSPPMTVTNIEADASIEPTSVPAAAPTSLAARTMDPIRDGVHVEGDVLRMTIDAHEWQVRGLPDRSPGAVLKVNVRVRGGEALALHVDSIDLYHARARAVFATQAAVELKQNEAVIRRELGRVLLACEDVIAQREAEATKPKASAQTVMTESAQASALTWLRTPNLLDAVLADFEACGLAGERTNKLVGYLAAISRKLDRPLGVVVQSSSAAGKTTLMDAVLAFVPEEEKVRFSAMSGQSLFYIGETDLRHKVLAIAEEEGASRASYALKLLQSEGELTMASTGKDATTGNLVTQTYRVEGPVALLLTTTARDIDEELMNRCLVLAVDEGREQTRAIHERQRERRTLAGLLARHDKADCIERQQNAQRLLKPLAVLNPYAKQLSFPDQSTRLRRDHEKYLTLIDTIALLHQHQRPIKSCVRGDERIEYIEVTVEDIAQANALAHEVLGRSLDELPPQTRRLLSLIDGFVAKESERQRLSRSDFHFSRRDLREAINWGDTQLKVHLARLVELEYLLVHRAKGGGFVYELVYELAQDHTTLRLAGLTDIEALRDYDADRSGQDDAWSAPGRGPVGPRSVGGRDAESAEDARTAGVCEDETPYPSRTHYKANGAAVHTVASYR